MKITKTIENIFQKYLPSPFTIAILLTLITLVLAVVFTRPADAKFFEYSLDVLKFWEGGIWNTKLLEFAYQMMLILILDMCWS
jgi:short-chain fatty acids transporter